MSSAPAAGHTRWATALIPGIAILLLPALALHAWPAGGSAQLRWPANLLLLGWVSLEGLWAFTRAGRRTLPAALPAAPVWAYMGACLLSVAAADHPARASVAAAKIVLSLLGAYTLVTFAGKDPRWRRWLLGMLCITAAGVVLQACGQLSLGHTAVGGFESPLKLGTFLAMVVPAAWVVLLSAECTAATMAGAVLVAGALAVCGSLWASVGIAAGVIAGACLSPQGGCRLAVAGAASAAVIVALVFMGRPWPLLADARLREADGQDLRQRYIEWQAQVNLLKDRAAAGVGIGCLNDYRSAYYMRLPKRNTIAPFDQNGWLATAAETGLPGLLAFSWMVWHYLGRAFRRRGSTASRAAGASILAACFANVASAVQYAGLMPMFAVLLALAEWPAPAGDSEGR